jgi:hypothetical protein
MAIYNTTVDSSWIKGLTYCPAAKGVDMPTGTRGFLVIETREGGRFAHAVPPTHIGLLIALSKRKGSVGGAYNRLIRGRWPSVRIN